MVISQNNQSAALRVTGRTHISCNRRGNRTYICLHSKYAFRSFTYIFLSIIPKVIMSCCPPGSLPSLLDTSYQPKGKILYSPKIDYYIIEPSEATNKAIIFSPDVWGWNTGRIRFLADYFSQALCATVVIPKALQPALEGGTEGDGLPPVFDLTGRLNDLIAYFQTLPWDMIVAPMYEAMVEELQKSGKTSLAMVGFCYGGWVCVKLMAQLKGKVQFKCGVVPHPSIHLEDMVYQKNLAEVLEAVEPPYLLMPCGNDSDRYRSPDGDIINGLSKTGTPSKTMNTEFANMIHGFTTRGDVSDPATAKAIELFLQSSLEFMKQYL